MLVVHSQLQRGHDPARELSLGLLVPAYEVPGRADAIVAALTAEREHTLVAPPEHGEAPILAVHDAAMLRYLERCWADWTAAGHAGQPIVPDTLPHERMRPLLNDISVTTRDQLTAFYDFDNAAARLERIINTTEPEADPKRTLGRRQLFTRLFKLPKDE